MTRLGKNQRKMLAFGMSYPGWHSISKYDSATKKVALSLEKRGLLILKSLSHNLASKAIASEMMFKVYEERR